MRDLSSLRVMLVLLLNEYCLKNACAMSSQVLQRDDSNEAYHLYVMLLDDNGNKVSNYASSRPRSLITML